MQPAKASMPEDDLPIYRLQLRASARLDRIFALLVAICAFALYLRTLAPGLLGGDSGEFQFAAWLGGFAHPTGYPLYLMLGWLWTHLLPFGDPAWRMNLLSALAGGVAVGLVYLLAVRVLRPDPPALLRQAQDKLCPARDGGGSLPSPGRRGGWGVRSVALFAALTFAVTPTFWSQAIVAEVYALNAFFVAAILLGLVTWAETRSRRTLYITAIIFGLSLAHHRTTLLYLPAIIVYLWLIARRPHPSTTPVLVPTGSAQDAQVSLGGQDAPLWHFQPGKHAGLSVYLLVALCLLAPLLLYAYIPLRAPHTPYFQVAIGSGQALQLYQTTLGGFIEHISGAGFGSALGAGRFTAAGLRALAELFARELTLPGLALGLLGASWLAWRNRPLLALTGLSFLAIIGFNLFYGIGDIYVFYIPAYLIWVLWMAAGVWACVNLGGGAEGRGSGGVKVTRGHGDTANRRIGESANHATPNTQYAIRNTLPLVYLFPCLLAFALPLYLLLTNFPHIDRSRDNAARTAWEAILAQPLPQGAILVTNDRDEMVPQWYLKYVEGRRPDVIGLFPLIQPGPAWADVGAVTDQALRSGRPVYLIKPMPGLEVKFELAPVLSTAQGPAGTLLRVLGPAAASPPARPAAAIYGDALRLAGYDLDPATFQPGGTAEITLHWQPIKRLDADYTTFVHLLDADGNKIAQSDHQPGGVYYPTSLWKSGEMLADRHTLTLPAALGRAPYTIVVGLYSGVTEIHHLGAPQQVGEW